MPPGIILTTVLLLHEDHSHTVVPLSNQVLIYTAERTGASWREHKCPSFETVAKWMLSYRSRQSGYICRPIVDITCCFDIGILQTIQYIDQIN